MNIGNMLNIYILPMTACCIGESLAGTVSTNRPYSMLQHRVLAVCKH